MGYFLSQITVSIHCHRCTMTIFSHIRSGAATQISHAPLSYSSTYLWCCYSLFVHIMLSCYIGLSLIYFLLTLNSNIHGPPSYSEGFSITVKGLSYCWSFIAHIKTTGESVFRWNLFDKDVCVSVRLFWIYILVIPEMRRAGPPICSTFLLLALLG